MSPVEIEEAISALAQEDFDSSNFAFAFLEAFGNKETTINRLRSGNTNSSDIENGVLQRNNIHIATCPRGMVSETLIKLKESTATKKGKVKFVLATDGNDFEAENITSDDAPVICSYKDFPEHFGYFLPLAGISTVKQIRESSVDIQATARLNRLYVELLKDNPEWATTERRQDMNHFMARLIFSFFAEDTDIFNGSELFTKTVDKMSSRDSSDTHKVISEIFRAMDIDTSGKERQQRGVPRWADKFPFVNGGLFSGSTDTPKFSKIARSYLLNIGRLDWTKINPDIFGSMIQAVTDEEERGALGLHYTSVPNILKVLNPLFLNDLKAKLDEAGSSPIKLLNLRKRISKLRVFDPACGSGNFLVIAYKELRAIEAEVNKRRGEEGLKSEIPLTNFRGIELRDFPAEVARLALIIAEYQCDVLYRGQKEALAELLPLDAMNWIICGNALRLDWRSVCPPISENKVPNLGASYKQQHKKVKVEFENQDGETYICGNPPFTGTRKQSEEQKEDLKSIYSPYTKKWKNADYVGAWLLKAAKYNESCKAPFAFVATNSLCQGQQVPITWSIIKDIGCQIRFAYTSFSWSNLAKNKAGVTVIIVGLDFDRTGDRYLYSEDNKKVVDYINPYLTAHNFDVVTESRKPLFTGVPMDYGVYYSKSGGLILSHQEKESFINNGFPKELIKQFLGSTQFINGKSRYCFWLDKDDLDVALKFPDLKERIESVKRDRLETKDKAVNKLASRPHQFREKKGDGAWKILIPIVSSENRDYLPIGLADKNVIPTNKMFYIEEPPLWCLSILSSRLHLVWIAAICGRLRSDYSYSNTLGWNTFPLPKLTIKNKNDLNHCAKEILLARERYFPKSLAELYEVKDTVSQMPEDLRIAHEANDEVFERIYIGRRFKNDTERLEKLFDLYTKMNQESEALN